MDDDLKINTGAGWSTMSGSGTNITSVPYPTIGNGGAGTITTSSSTVTIAAHDTLKNIKDRWELNELFVEHKVQEMEMIKLKEVDPDYGSHIKENLAKNASRELIKKMTFTKKYELNTDVHHFRGRAWVFTDDELTNFIKDVQGV